VGQTPWSAADAPVGLLAFCIMLTGAKETDYDDVSVSWCGVSQQTSRFRTATPDITTPESYIA
jgi:hypothetical protein